MIGLVYLVNTINKNSRLQYLTNFRNNIIINFSFGNIVFHIYDNRLILSFFGVKNFFSPTQTAELVRNPFKFQVNKSFNNQCDIKLQSKIIGQN
ncbi:hypothetical protein LX64_00782 [Chitinophaga skermanii]|uniref:Uncharacterized protein n=1 Tax=Chitinophaga skermanii TaxID=331697 RepID=A0A327R658_9BACT|nr:hypothetical protein LX64_00782 [Chitinophaga skermanii]